MVSSISCGCGDDDDDAPAQCDALVGRQFKLSIRFVLEAIETMIPDTLDLNMKFSGWGHEMTMINDVADLGQDWVLLNEIFENWTGNCPDVD